MVVTVSAAVLGAVAARWIPADGLRIGYGVLMLVLAAVLLRGAGPDDPDGASPGERAPGRSDAAEGRRIETRDGLVYEYRPHGMVGQQVLSGAGASWPA